MAVDIININGVTRRDDEGVYIYNFPRAIIQVNTNPALAADHIIEIRHNDLPDNFESKKFSEYTDTLGQSTAVTFVNEMAIQSFFFNSIDSNVNIGKNDLAYDAWGRAKTITDRSIIHALFTFGIPINQWEETLNGVSQAFTNFTSENGHLKCLSGIINDKSVLRTYRNPRYQPNRGMLYSTAGWAVNPLSNMVREWGIGTDESAVFFRLKSTGLHAVIRTTIDAVTTEDETLLDTSSFDLSKGNIYDIQFQWRGVGSYKFFINNVEVLNNEYLGTLTSLSMYNPALPMFFSSENLGDNDPINFGCVDVTSEGGDIGGKSYGSVSISNDNGQVGISGLNLPIIAIRSKLTVNSKINTRDTLALLATAYADQRCMFRIWSTRDLTSITENDQSWVDFGDGHLEYIEYNNPVVPTPITFDTNKASLIFSSRVNIDNTYTTSALFHGQADIYLTPGELFIFTMHRETGGNANVGVTFEFAEEI